MNENSIDIHLNDADKEIIEQLEIRPNLAANIASETGYRREYLSQRLRRLEEHDVVRNVGNGLYELVEK